MTDKTRYYQAKNRQALNHGGLFRCPSCIGVVEQIDGNYYCGYCAFAWDADGEPVLVITP